MKDIVIVSFDFIKISTATVLAQHDSSDSIFNQLDVSSLSGPQASLLAQCEGQ